MGVWLLVLIVILPVVAVVLGHILHASGEWVGGWLSSGGRSAFVWQWGGASAFVLAYIRKDISV